MMLKQRKAHEKIPSFYGSNYDHLGDELQKLDLLIQQRVIAFRIASQSTPDANAPRQMCISHEEVDWLLSKTRVSITTHPDLEKLRKRFRMLQGHIDIKIRESMKRGVFLALPQLAQLLALSPFELQTIIICLAPELYRKYDKLYAYLQDDITRKKPSVDLVLDLLCDTKADRWTARTVFSDHARLFSAGLLHSADDPQSPSGSSGLAQFLRLDHRILNYLLGNNNIDGRLVSLAEPYRPLVYMDHIMVDQPIKTKLLNLTEHYFSSKKADGKRLALYFQGSYGVGKRDLALGICGKLNCPMLYVDMEQLLAEEDFETLVRLAFREGLLLQSALYLDHVDGLLGEDNKAKALMRKLARVIGEYGWLTFLAGEKSWTVRGLFEHANFHTVKLSVADVPLREKAWTRALESVLPEAETTWAEKLARQFRLTPGQIRDAAEFANNECEMRSGKQGVALVDLECAARNQSNHKLTELAIKINPSYSWEDIVLPEGKLTQLREICNQVKHRYRVFGEWGFDAKLSHGKGLSVLFTGLPGTGKTMAAEVIARELRLDLYKIDLSGVVSKYIGETEKNLAKIFYEAETSNAILFFDEADALFGKRTEVSDAHDRYANIETSYLLQKMEEYEGVVILATNLRENMDEAFTRRIRFIVEFPFPDTKSRMEIWKTHFPNAAPLSDDINYEFLGNQFQVAGGNIKNIVLNSAFMAAEDGGEIKMEHVLHAVKREFEKSGKLWSEKNLYRLVDTME